MKLSGRLTAKVVLKTDHKREEGTHAVYLQCFVQGQKLMIPLGFAVKASQFDKKGQKIRKNHPEHSDMNLIIENTRSRVFKIATEFRLRDQILTRDLLYQEYHNPTPTVDFIKFCEHHHELAKGLIEDSTWRSKNGTIGAIKRWRKTLLFSELGMPAINDFTRYRRKQGLKESTVQKDLKNFKSWLNLAERYGIKLPFNLREMKVTQPKAMITYLNREEIGKLFSYYHHPDCPESFRNTLQVFLFACFTGLRYSDLADLSWSNIEGDRLTYVPRKTKKFGKFLTVRLPEKAKSLLSDHLETPFERIYTNQAYNRNLKEISKIVGLRKKITSHVARHTFATMFLEMGGDVEVLRELMCHSNIRETMVYVKISSKRKDEQIAYLDKMF
ncbi:MAG: site-specific integrase [Bacteroidota bacterium]|nr:site-specific integrase [Bacteroidota bacterium]